MQIKKILLKDLSGRVVATATLTLDNESILKLPKGFRLIAASAEGRRIPFGKGDTLPPCSDLTFLSENERGECFIGSTLPPRESTFRAGLLIAEREEAIKKEQSLDSPLKDTISRPSLPSRENTKAKATSVSAEDLTTRFDITEIEPEETQEETNLPEAGEGIILPAQAEGTAPVEEREGESEVPRFRTIDASLREASFPQEDGETRDASKNEENALLSRAEALLRAGTPCPLFEEIIPNSRWTKVEEECGASFIGILEEGGERSVLFAIAGKRDEVPEEANVLTFVPTEEKESEGFFILRG